MPSDRELRSIDLNPPLVFPTAPVEPEQTASPLDAAVEQLTDTVRTVYIATYRAFKDDPRYGEGGLPHYDGEGGRDRFGRRNPAAVWPKLARQIVSLDADPLTYIHAQFQAATRGRAPTPQMMLGDAAAENYRAHVVESVPALRRKLESDRVAVQATVSPLVSVLRWEPQRALKQALFNVTAVSASPLFRLCLAIGEGFDDVVRYFYGRGVIQYAFQQRAYDEAWGEFIPPVVRAEGTALRQRLLGRAA